MRPRSTVQFCEFLGIWTLVLTPVQLSALTLNHLWRPSPQILTFSVSSNEDTGIFFCFSCPLPHPFFKFLVLGIKFRPHLLGQHLTTGSSPTTGRYVYLFIQVSNVVSLSQFFCCFGINYNPVFLHVFVDFYCFCL